MGIPVVEIVPLIGEKHAVGLGLAELIGKPAGDALIVVRVTEWFCRHFDKRGAAQPEHVFLFLALRVRHNDERPVTACIGDQRDADSRVACGALDD